MQNQGPEDDSERAETCRHKIAFYVVFLTDTSYVLCIDKHTRMTKVKCHNFIEKGFQILYKNQVLKTQSLINKMYQTN